MVGDTRQREPKGKEDGLTCVLKLSDKRTTVGEFSGESLAGGDRRGKSAEGGQSPR